MKLVTIDQMRQLEQRAADIDLPPEALMENAGLAVAEEVRKLRGSIAGSPILILVGPGNNGGDGLVVARHLDDWGSQVTVYIYDRRTDGDKNFELLEERGVPITYAEADESLSTLDDALSSAEVVVDALFGTGKLRPLQGTVRSVLDLVSMIKGSRPQLTVVAVDLPSGLDADTGAVDQACLSADVTITLGCPKVGLFGFPGSEKVGKLVVADIGIPPSLTYDVSTELMTADWVRSALPHRPLNSNKGSFGKVLVASGSVNYIGAAYLACAAASRVGAGLVTLATARSLQPILASKLVETTYAPLPEADYGIIGGDAAPVLREHLEDYDVLLMGCGLGQHPSTMDFIRDSLFSLPSASSHSLVLDADALNTLARTPDWWQSLKSEAVLTPHPGEMARLTGLSVSDIQSDRLGITGKAAARWQKVVVLKGAYTVIAAPDGQAKLNPIANPGLATAGTGDVLSGAIAGLLAQGVSPFDAACCGAYLHGMAGEIVREELGDAGMIAGDLLQALPLAIKRLKERQADH
ncbi:MAG: NAD(P)H-hydrate dehydratase [Dehalococcoidia bacterium]